MIHDPGAVIPDPTRFLIPVPTPLIPDPAYRVQLGSLTTTATTTVTATSTLQNNTGLNNTGFSDQTNGLHVRYNFWYISLPHYAKPKREMNKFKFYGLSYLSELERHSYQKCSKIVQTNSTRLTSKNNCDAI